MDAFPLTKSRSGEVRVVLQNLWGRRGAWAERRSVLITGLSALQPDLVVFNEAIKNQEYDQVLDLLGSGWDVVHQSQREAKMGDEVEEGQGVSMASRRKKIQYSNTDEGELHAPHFAVIVIPEM